jgi:acyl-CoA dehydrogenase
MCWGDVGLFLARPGTGLGNAAIMAVGNPDQKAYGEKDGLQWQ